MAGERKLTWVHVVVVASIGTVLEWWVSDEWQGSGSGALPQQDKCPVLAQGVCPLDAMLMAIFWGTYAGLLRVLPAGCHTDHRLLRHKLR